MMIELISSTLSELVDEKQYSVQTLTNPRDIFHLDSDILDSNNFFLFPLEAAISAPMIFRSIHYRSMFSNRNNKWSTLLHNILVEGEKVISEKKGIIFAENWFYDMKNNIHNLILSGKYNSIIVDDTGVGFCEIIKDKSVGTSSWVDRLNLNLGDESPLLIAERTVRTKHTIYSSKLDGFITNSSSPHLLELLADFEQTGKEIQFKSHHHLYSWLAPSIRKEASFFRDIVMNYLRDSTHGKTQSAYILIVSDISNHDLELSSLISAKGKLSLQRADYTDQWMLMSKSLSDNINQDDVMTHLNLIGIDTDLLEHIEPMYIEEDSKIETQYVAILFKCDVNSWLSSREIDGEQVMTNN